MGIADSEQPAGKPDNTGQTAWGAATPVFSVMCHVSLLSRLAYSVSATGLVLQYVVDLKTYLFLRFYRVV